MTAAATRVRNACYRKILVLLLVLLAIGSGCGSEEGSTLDAPIGDSASSDAATVRVVATTNIIADWVENVGGERVDVFSILPPAADPHGFVPRPTDVTAISKADLVLSIGLGLEADWLEELLRNAVSDESKVIALGDIASPIKSNDRSGSGNNEPDHGTLDPHFWFDPLRVKSAVNDIVSRLSVLDPDGEKTYRDNAAIYNQRLESLHEWVQQRVSTVPSERRLLVTSHDSLQYFATVYDFKIVGTVFPSSATDVEPSAGDLGDLTRAMDDYSVSAIFGETTVTERLAAAIANETDAKLVRLYSGSLGAPGSGAESYIAMMETNVDRIVEALE
jgi:ABC-type Zn uptake system ZnuABC Zn-binding protein ZnuA